jgi:DNA-binding NarL/FixJ family response regulator
MGQTNREIADALFISARTVEVHVAASLRKLGLASRHELRNLPTPPGEAKIRS